MSFLSAIATFFFKACLIFATLSKMRLLSPNGEYVYTLFFLANGCKVINQNSTHPNNDSYLIMSFCNSPTLAGWKISSSGASGKL
jgi:hypothetical protein